MMTFFEGCKDLRVASTRFEGRKALVTGGSKGIGRETTELFLSLGAEARPRDAKVDIHAGRISNTLLGTNISPPKSIFESMIFLFPRWDMLVLWRVFISS